MEKSPSPKPDNPEQSKRFIDTAKELGIPDSGEEFERAMESIIPPKKPPDKP